MAIKTRQFGPRGQGAPLSFFELDYNWEYFNNMTTGSEGYIPLMSGSKTVNIPGLGDITYAPGAAMGNSVLQQVGEYNVATVKIVASSSFEVQNAITASAVSASKLLADTIEVSQITGSLLGTGSGLFFGTMSGSFSGSSVGKFSGQVDGTSSFTTVPLQTILNNGSASVLPIYIGTGSSFNQLRSDGLILATGSYLQMNGSASINGTLFAQVTQLGNGPTDHQRVIGTLNITGSSGDAITVSTGRTYLQAAILTGSLQVSGATTLNGDVSVVSAGKVILGTGTFTLEGAASLSSSLQVSGTTTLNGALDTTTNTSLGGTLSVNGATSLSSSLQVSGATTFNNNVTISNANTFTVGTGLSTLGGALTVSGITTLNGRLDTTTNTALGGTLSVNGATSLSSSLAVVGVLTNTDTTDSTSTSSGAVRLSGGLGMSKALWVGGLTNIAGSLTVGGATQLNSTVGATGVVTLTNATEATSTSTGAAILSGGVGIAKNVWVGGTLNVAGAVSLGTITGTLVNALTVDNSSLEYTAGTTYDNSSARTIRVKASGIVNSMIADSTIANIKLANNTISGKALGTNLDTLTIGTGLSGTSYNGSAAVTIANTGVTSAVAGSNITVSAATGAVTIAASSTPTFSGAVTATGFFQSSKRSLKTGIIDFDKDALDIIRRTKIVEFYYLTDLGNKHIGFIADDTPVELSTKNQDIMDTNSTVAVLLKAVQQLEARVVDLEKQLASK